VLPAASAACWFDLSVSICADRFVDAAWMSCARACVVASLNCWRPVAISFARSAAASAADFAIAPFAAARPWCSAMPGRLPCSVAAMPSAVPAFSSMPLRRSASAALGAVPSAAPCSIDCAASCDAWCAFAPGARPTGPICCALTCCGVMAPGRAICCAPAPLVMAVAALIGATPAIVCGVTVCAPTPSWRGSIFGAPVLCAAVMLAAGPALGAVVMSGCTAVAPAP
jgi:hypothetical protein